MMTLDSDLLLGHSV